MTRINRFTDFLEGCWMKYFCMADNVLVQFSHDNIVGAELGFFDRSIDFLHKTATMKCKRMNKEEALMMTR